jgi:hypothetical protein
MTHNPAAPHSERDHTQTSPPPLTEDRATPGRKLSRRQIGYSIFSFGYFPGVRLSFADVSKHSVRSNFKGWMKNEFFINPLKMDLTEGPETSAKLHLTPGTYPEENIQDSEHGKNLK